MGNAAATTEYGISRLTSLVTNQNNGTWQGDSSKGAGTNFMNTNNDKYSENALGKAGVEDKKPYSESLNWAKVWRLRFGGTRNSWDNWHSKTINHIVKIDDNVQLISEKNELALSLKQKYGELSLDDMCNFGPIQKLKGKLKGVGSIASSASGFLEKGIDGIVTSNYAGLKGLRGLEPITIPGSLTFTFYFGQAGLYDATQEVVFPILALAGCVAAYNPDSKYPHMFRSQVASADYLAGQILRQVISSAIAKGASFLQDLADSMSEESTEKKDASKKGTSLVDGAIGAAESAAESALGIAMSVNDAIHSVIDNTYSAVMYKGSNRMAYFKLGVLEIGPCYIESADMSFDYTATDSNGMPTKGSVTFQGISTPLLSTAGNIKSMLNNQFVEKAVTGTYEFNPGK